MIAPWSRVSAVHRNASVRVDQLDGDALLVSYDRDGGARIRRKGYPHERTPGWHDGVLVWVRTEDGHEVTVTPDHRVLTRWSTRPGHALYLMRSADDHWRIGTAQLHLDSQGYSFGPARRAVEEGAVEQWLLDVFATESAARVAERAMGREFGITEQCFHRYRARLAARGPQVGEEPNPYALLARFHRDPGTPFWRVGSRAQRGCRAYMTLPASNLVPGWMEVATDGGANVPRWLPFTAGWFRYDGPVLGVAVPKYQHFVADGVVLTDNPGGRP